MPKNIYDIVYFVAAVSTIIVSVYTIWPIFVHPTPIITDLNNGPYNTDKVLSDMGKHYNATQTYKDAIGPEPDDEDAWYKEGETLKNQGKYEGALLAYKNAITLDSSDPRAWYGKEFVDRKLGHTSDANTDLAMAKKREYIPYPV